MPRAQYQLFGRGEQQGVQHQAEPGERGRAPCQVAHAPDREDGIHGQNCM